MVSFLYFLVAVSAANPAPVREPAQEDILALVKRDSTHFCSEPNMSCTFSAKKTSEGWLARAALVYTAPDCHKAYPIGGDHWYIYSPQGKLLRDEPGL